MVDGVCYCIVRVYRLTSEMCILLCTLHIKTLARWCEVENHITTTIKVQCAAAHHVMVIYVSVSKNYGTSIYMIVTRHLAFALQILTRSYC